MKREILFRGKSPKGHWIYGMPSYDLKYVFNDNNYDSYEQFEVIPETVGQFTGLTDRNGVKIFEGDIVFNKNRTLITCKEDTRTYLVEWINGEYREEDDGVVWLHQKPSFVFSKIRGSGPKYMSLVFSQEQIEIIGNIHDNPELIKS